jgi:hypothetical protein
VHSVVYIVRTNYHEEHEGHEEEQKVEHKAICIYLRSSAV